jgi:hypothetical protein
VKNILTIFKNIIYLTGLTGTIIGFEIIAIAIYMVTLPYLRNPLISGTIANLSLMIMTLTLVSYFLKKSLNE